MSKIPDIEVLCFNGSYDTRKNSPGSQYSTITLSEIVNRVRKPTTLHKQHAPAIIPSSYREHDARSHGVQRENGSFHLLCIDIDTGSHCLEAVKTALEDLLGDCAIIVYSTASSSSENKKWRALIPIAKPLLGSQYTATQSTLFDLLAKVGIECDRSLDRTGQPIYLPNIPSDRRDHTLNGAPPLFYEYDIRDGEALDLTTTAIPALREAKEKEENERFQKKIEEANQRRGLSELMGITVAVSQIEIYNRDNPLDETLERYGYTYGGNDNWRSPHQQGKTFATKIYGSKWFSLSTSDGDIGRPAGCGARFGSAFDLYVHYEHRGSLKEAYRSLKSKHKAHLLASVRADQQCAEPENCNLEVTELSSGTDDKTPLNNINSNIITTPNELTRQTKVEQQKDRVRRFEEALADLELNPDQRDLRTRAIHYYADLDSIDKVLAEDQLTRVTGLNKMTLRSAAKEASAATNGPSDLTHSEIVDVLLKEYHLQSNAPIGNGGSMFFYDVSGIWKSKRLSDIEIQIGREFRSQKNSKRTTDYNGIAKLLYISTEDPEFFNNANPGICTTEGFWEVSGKEVVKVPHSRENRARHQLAIEPDFSDEPKLFKSLLLDAFDDPTNKGAADEQLRLIRQLFGAAILGLQTNLQRAVFLYGTAGSGKSLTLRVLERLFNPSDVTVVSLHEMDQDYKKATLAHKRLNIVPELDADKPIPSAAFKATLGEDRLNARLPYHVPFTFKCEAACWFNGNMKPMTRDHGDAFYRRWIIIPRFNFEVQLPVTC